jgi:hypothetical protein
MTMQLTLLEEQKNIKYFIFNILRCIDSRDVMAEVPTRHTAVQRNLVEERANLASSMHFRAFLFWSQNKQDGARNYVETGYRQLRFGGLTALGLIAIER